MFVCTSAVPFAIDDRRCCCWLLLQELIVMMVVGLNFSSDSRGETFPSAATKGAVLRRDRSNGRTGNEAMLSSVIAIASRLLVVVMVPVRFAIVVVVLY